MNAFQRDYGPWVLITGASSGLGAEFAQQLAAKGLHLLLVARNLAALEVLASTLRETWKIEVRVLALDLSEPTAATTLVSWVGALDVGLVVSNAGAGTPAPFLEIPAETHARSFELNGLVHARLAHQLGPHLRSRSKAGLLLVAAMGAQHGIPYMAADAAAKALIVSLGRALNQEWRASGVNVTVLSPGPTQTPVIQKLGFDALTLPMRPASASACVREGLRALERNKPTIVSGRLFRWMGALLPAKAWTSMNGFMLGQAARALAARRETV